MSDDLRNTDVKFLEEIVSTIENALDEFFEQCRVEEDSLLVLGASSSEILGEKIGTHSSVDVANACLAKILENLEEKNITLAVQCCEHLNRSLVLPKAYAKKCRYTMVNAIPQPKAGGAFASLYWECLDSPVLVESIQADLGIDIGDTFIGMHLKPVAIPVRVGVKSIGEAHLTLAKTRLKRIGGERAIYQED